MYFLEPSFSFWIAFLQTHLKYKEVEYSFKIGKQ